MNLEGRQKGTTTSDKNNLIYAVKNIIENFPEEFAKDNLGAGNFDENFKSYSPLGIAEIKKIGVLDMNILKDKEQTMGIVDNGTFEEKLDSNCNDFYQHESAEGNDNAYIASSLLSLNNSSVQDNEAKVIKKMKKKKNLTKKASTSSNATTRTINSLNSLGRSKSFL
jgi:hypothetical protein